MLRILIKTEEKVDQKQGGSLSFLYGIDQAVNFTGGDALGPNEVKLELPNTVDITRGQH